MRERAGHTYCFRTFRLDIAERRLLDRGVPVPLAPRAFEVLVKLVENAGHLVEKDDLLLSVWGGSFVEEANIARVIHTLRRALGESEDGQAKFIETVAKKGYRFVAEVTVVDGNSKASAEPANDARRPQAAPPSNAFQAWQLARYHFNLMTPPDLLQSRALLEEAIRLDPGYAPAHAALAEQAVQEVVAGLRAPGVSYPEAKRSLARARELDSKSVDFYTASGFVHLLAEWDFDRAEDDLRHALELSPHNSFAILCLGEVFMFQGRSNEAYGYLQTASNLEPANLSHRNLLPISLFLARKYRQALEECDRMLALYPRFIIAEWIRCWILEQTGRADEAVRRYEELLRDQHGELLWRWIGYAYARVGNRKAALDSIARLDAESGEHYLSPSHQALAYAGLGDAESALSYLELGISSRDPWMLWLATDPRYDVLRSDPRFGRMVEAVIGVKDPPGEVAADDDSRPRHRVSRSGAHAIVDLSEWREVMERAGAKETLHPAASSGPARSRWRWAYAGLSMVLILVSVIGLVTWLAAGSREPVEYPLLTNPFSAERLSTDGKVLNAVVSPNGKLVVYSHSTLDDNASVWLRNLETGHNREILSPSADIYFGLEFSPDGDWLYFVRRARGEGMITGIYRVSIHGGPPEKIVSDTQGWLSISPDGSRIGFVRCAYKEDDYCSLFVADSRDGGNERKLVTRPQPYRIRDLDFSPDGKTIAFAAGQSENMGMAFQLWAYDLEPGTERELSGEKFFNITGVAWLSNADSILLTGSRLPQRTSRIWRLDVDTGRIEPLSKDSDAYLSLSVDDAGSKLVSTRYEEGFRLRILSRDLTKSSTEVVLPKASAMRFAPDGTLLYASVASGRNEIWRMNPDGSGKKQLTSSEADDTLPVPAARGDTIYFASNRTGSVHVWRMNADGVDQMQVTRSNGGFPLGVSVDGEWVYYHHETNRALWRVRAAGGDEEQVIDRKRAFAISPDANLVAYSERVDGDSFLVIASLATGEPGQKIRIDRESGWLTQFVWLPDGKGVAYFVTTNEYRNNTLFIQRLGDGSRPMKVIEIDEMLHEAGALAISPDGKTFAVSQGSWLHDAVLIKGLK